MAVTAKAFYETLAQEMMLKALVTDAVHDYDSGGHEGITKVSAKTTSGSGLGSFSADITWASVSTSSVSKSNTPVINVAASNTINYIELNSYNTTISGYYPLLVFTINAEAFPYAGSITITGCTLSISDTVS